MSYSRIFNFAVVPALFVACASSCSKPEDPDVKAKREFREALVVAVTNASRIEVVEHSHVNDFLEIYSPGEDGIYSSDEVPTVEYARVPLNGEQRDELSKTLRAMDASEPLVISFCAAAPRHSIEFHSDNGVSSRLAVCFGCSKLEWSERDLEGDPISWVNGLEAFVGGLGMKPKADWEGRLKNSGRLEAFEASSGWRRITE
ncbi:hypothetical protein OJ996_25865 [Luteolibacter sp. GHJ8]|uniref:Uncharacterized protein n=1 Tax=Luteolibacter rhizosphaerae TaxID=2989719 RepID=A0ABT3GB29_9BACT|nr:hypothetical protein [Luteolibacter rhizosphaerae]MCW1917043.1 hypothetical protein [Luteolibacter rhizosphaerae]